MTEQIKNRIAGGFAILAGLCWLTWRTKEVVTYKMNRQDSPIAKTDLSAFFVKYAG
jgi:hypothetical protein